MVHDAGRGGEHDEAELTRRQELDDPFLEVTDTHVVAGGDDAGFVNAVGCRLASDPPYESLKKRKEKGLQKTKRTARSIG